MGALVILGMLVLAAVAPRHGVDSRPDFTTRPDWRNRLSWGPPTTEALLARPLDVAPPSSPGGGGARNHQHRCRRSPPDVGAEAGRTAYL